MRSLFKKKSRVLLFFSFLFDHTQPKLSNPADTNSDNYLSHQKTKPKQQKHSKKNCQKELDFKIARSQAQIFPSKITTFPRHKYKTWANQNRIKKKPIKREEKIFKRNSKNKQIEISTAVKRET